ncbi:MAG: hypothetical protein ACRDCD_01950 [Mycoplasmoidaceae bacterium]
MAERKEKKKETKVQKNTKIETSLYDEISKVLDLILSNNELLQNLNDKTFYNSFSTLLNNFRLLENKIKPKVSLLDKYTGILNNLNKKVEFSKEKLDNEIDIKDNINFIRVFIKNLTHKDLESFTAEEIKKDNNSSTEEKTQTTENSTSSGEYNYGNYEDYKKNILNQMVQKRLAEDMLSGKYYFFDSKPKAVPILRYVIGVMIILASLILLSIVIVGSMTKLKLLNKDGEVVDLTLFSNPFTMIFIIIFICLFIFSGYKYLIPVKNDNAKYNLSNLSLGLSVFGGILLLSLSIQPLSQLDSIIKQYVDAGTTKENIELFKAWNWIMLSLSLLLISFGIPMIINYVVRPKKDLKLTQELTEKYKREIHEKGIIK